MAGKEDFITQLPHRYRNAHISKITGWEEELGHLKNWVEQSKNFLIIMGCPGCGKTYLSIALLIYLFEFKNESLKVEFVNVRELFNILKKCFSTGGNEIKIKEIIGDTDWLVLDDLGASRNNEWQQEVLLDIIDDRYNSMKPTIITTNSNYDQIGESLGHRIQSRLAASENCTVEKWDLDLRKLGL